MEFRKKIRAEQGLPPLPEGPPPVQPYDDLMWAWRGWWRLSNTRPQGFNGPLRIPHSEINAYCDLCSFAYSKRQDFLIYIHRLDEFYMEHVRETMAKQEEENARKAKQQQKNR